MKKENQPSPKKQAIIDNLSNIFGALSFDNLEKLEVVAKYLDAAQLPNVAPELYIDRPKGESTSYFLTRVYGKDIENGLPKSHFRKIDMQLYNALTNWNINHKDKINIHTKAKRTDQLLASEDFKILKKLIYELRNLEQSNRRRHTIK